jgi:hypothetical protein
MLCEYKDIFGKPQEGLHAYRDYFFNTAVVDWIALFIVALILSITLNTNIYTTSFFLFILSILIHRIFCVKTTVDNFLFN